jgi:hypothetical protein
MGADLYVMSNLHQVIEFDTVSNHGVFQSTTVNARISANFDMITNANCAELFYFFPTTVDGGKAKTICANHNACVQDAMFTDRAIHA